MSAASQALGLAQSQDTIPKDDYESYEDPARSWIDFVTAIKSGNKNSIQVMFDQAKASHWSHDLWNDATKEPEGSDTQSYDSDEMEDPLFTARDSRNVKSWQKIADTQDEFWEE